MMWRILFLVVLLCAMSPVFGIKINSDNYQLVPLNSNATFSCSDTMHHIQAFIVTFVDEAPLDTIVLSEVIESLAKRNVYLDSTDSSLFVLATEENNGTIIQCRDVSIEGMTDFSEQLTLMVIGSPSAPEIQVEEISTTELELQWNEPFTWPGYPVLDYYITQEGNTVDSDNTTNQTFTYAVSPDVEQEPCTSVMFNVTARNGLGNSIPGTIVTGLPIVPPLFKREDIDVDVQFTQGGQPIATITVKPPVVCDYQTVPVSVELTDQNGNKLVKYLEYRGNQSLLTVVFDMDDGLVANLNYSLVVTAISGAGNISSEPNKFNTTGHFNVWVPVIGGVAGALVFLMLVVLFIVVCCVVTQRKTKFAGLRRRSARNACSEQRDSTYEYIDDYHTVPPGSRKNQYLPHGYALRPLPRPDSPYQSMQAAETEASSSAAKTMINYHTHAPRSNNTTVPQTSEPVPNNDMHVTPGGSVVYTSRGSASSMGAGSAGAGSPSGEGEYTAMSSVGAVVANQKETMAARQSVTLPENALPYNGQPNGEYRFTEC